MSAEVDIRHGVVMVKMAGQVTLSEYGAAQAAMGNIIRKHGNVRVMVRAEDFDGWKGREAWGDLTVQEQNDPFIERMAIVADEKWKDLALIFAPRGLRRFPIEFFAPPDLPEAKSWLAA